MESTIILPENLSRVEGGDVFSDEFLTDLPINKLIVFVDSTECSKCKIDKFIRYRDLFEISERTNLFQLILMVSLGKKSHDDIVKYLQMTELDYPVYIDDENAFRKLNPAIPDDPRFHSLYFDRNGKVLLIGDPVGNTKINKLFMAQIGHSFSNQ